MEVEVFAVENANHKTVLLVIAEHEPEAEELATDILGEKDYFLVPLGGPSIVVKASEIVTNF